MAGSGEELRIGLKFSKSDSPIYDYLKQIPKLHRGYELKKLIMGHKEDVSAGPQEAEPDSQKKEGVANSKVKDSLKFHK